MRLILVGGTEEVQRIFNENVAREAYLLTDEANQYKGPGSKQTFHGTTNHSAGEYVRKDAPWIHTNTVEGYYSMLIAEAVVAQFVKACAHHFRRDDDFTNASAHGLSFPCDGGGWLALRHISSRIRPVVHDV